MVTRYSPEWDSVQFLLKFALHINNTHIHFSAVDRRDKRMILEDESFLIKGVCPPPSYLSRSSQSSAALITQPMRGTPARILMFFRGMPLLPPRARIRAALCRFLFSFAEISFWLPAASMLLCGADNEVNPFSSSGQSVKTHPSAPSVSSVL